jgi:hypothetical protein
MATETTIKAWKCEKCGKIYTDKHAAETCCKQYHCEICGCETPRYRLKCEPCFEKCKYDKATKITLSEWQEKNADNMVFYNDIFYCSVDDMLESLYDDGIDDLPTYCWGTDKFPMIVDADYAMECAEENTDCEDLSFSDSAREELREFVDKWNEKYGEYYFTVNDTVILIPEDVLNEYKSEELKDEC